MQATSLLLLISLSLACGHSSPEKPRAAKPSDDAYALLDSLPSDLGVVAFFDLWELADDVKQIPILNDALGKLSVTTMCVVEREKSESFAAIGMPFPLSLDNFFLVVSLPPTEECARIIAEFDNEEDRFVLEQVAPGQYRGASSLEKLREWKSSPIGGSAVVALIDRFREAEPIRLAVQPAEELVGNLLGGPKSQDQLVSFVASMQLDTTFTLDLELVWQDAVAATQGHKLMASAIASMLEVVGYGDFLEPILDGQKSQREGARVHIELGLDAAEWQAIVRRRAVYSLAETPIGDAATTYIVLPAGVVTSRGSLLSDSDLQRKVRESTMSTGFIGLATLPRIGHDRVTEVMRMLAPLGRSIVVSFTTASAVAIAGALTEVCESRKMPDACLNAGMILRDGIGVGVNLDAGNARLEQGCYQGNTPSCSELGGYELDDRDSAIRYWTGRAGEESALPAFRLGRLYGAGATKAEETQAAYWFKLAAERGHVGAMNELAIYYDAGKGVEPDEKLAIFWFEKATKTGGVTAMENLALFYRYSKEPKAHARAVHWFRKAAEKGSHKAHFYLGKSLLAGVGVKRDETQATVMFLKAAVGGYESAELPLATAYRDGSGVTRDYKKSAKWFRKAAERGESEAHLALGHMYLEGQGVAKNSAVAYAWLSLASDSHGSDERTNTVQMLLSQASASMASNDKDKAEKLARQYKSKYGRSEGGWSYGVAGGIIEDPNILKETDQK